MPALVEYIDKPSVFHRLNPLTKIIWTFAVLLLCFVFEQPTHIFIIFIANVLLAGYSGIFRNMVPILKGLAVFSLLLVLFQIFFVTEGQTLLYLVPFWKTGRITDQGLYQSVVMSLRMLTTVSTIPVLMMTTKMTDIAIVMVEWLKIPFKYTFMFITALRFIPTFMEEMEQILQAQMSRGYHSDTRNPFKKMVIIIPLAVPLLVSSIKKTEKMAISMEVRGFGAGIRSHYREIKMTGSDYIALLIMALSIAASISVQYGGLV